MASQYRHSFASLCSTATRNQRNTTRAARPKKKELNSTHRFLLISSRLMPAGGSTQSSQIRSCTSVRWHPAQWAAGGSKASAMVLLLFRLPSVGNVKRTAKYGERAPAKKGNVAPPCLHARLSPHFDDDDAATTGRRVRERRRIISPISLCWYCLLGRLCGLCIAPSAICRLVHSSIT